MKPTSRLLTLDSNVLIAALKKDEPYNEKCFQILSKVPDTFILTEPSIIYQEVCGTLARKTGKDIADQARKQLELMVHPALLINCDKTFCISAYPLCAEYNIYAIDALYLKVAIDNHAILVSLDKEDFIEKLKSKRLPIEAYHVTEFPY
ncbi:MAG: PIN domain-containing protein [Candidatus Bathyarchaeota archaeon]|nr:PIN domain-containing protein [Candidatus Bathyarchaeota archaeon]